MVERICPHCQAGNPLENRFCGQCGSALERNELAARREAGLTIAGTYLPARQIKQVGQALAVSLATIAAEAGMAWLRRKVEQIGQPAPVVQSTPPASQPARARAPIDQGAAPNIVTIVSQRVVEIWEQGSLTRQTVERTFWRREN